MVIEELLEDPELAKLEKSDKSLQPSTQLAWV
jgi:hypothetical protein